MTPEGRIKRAIRLALGMESDLVLWNLVQGTMRTPTGARYRGGLVNGASDLLGILGPHGRMVCLETKTLRNGPSKAQKLFRDLIRRHGGFYAVVRSVDEARDALERARMGEVE